MIQPVSALTSKALFRGSKNSSANPVNRRTEKRLAILNAGGISAVAGALTTVIARSYTASWKHASFWGVGAGLVTMMFICPRLLYKSGINSYKKERELDVFTKENEVQKKLLSDVNAAIDNHDESLHDKIDDYSKTKTVKEKKLLS